MFRKSKTFTKSARTQSEIIATVVTDRGCVRESNQDSGRVTRPNDPARLSAKGVLALVADGMGGHLGGEIASTMAVDVITRSYYESKNDVSLSLVRAFEEANRRIHAASLQDESLRGMGTTCTAVVICNESAIVAHVGDSRLYLVRNSEIYQLTEDHSVVMEMVRNGIITVEEARNHEDKNVIVRALGTAAAVEVSSWQEPLSVHDHDRFLLCSDGLYDLVPDTEIGDLVLAHDNHSACNELIRLAKKRGGHDNITVAILEVVPSAHPQPRELRETREAEVVL